MVKLGKSDADINTAVRQISNNIHINNHNKNTSKTPWSKKAINCMEETEESENKNNDGNIPEETDEDRQSPDEEIRIIQDIIDFENEYEYAPLCPRTD